jgi:hypothetical protein
MKVLLAFYAYLIIALENFHEFMHMADNSFFPMITEDVQNQFSGFRIRPYSMS